MDHSSCTANAPLRSKAAGTESFLPGGVPTPNHRRSSDTFTLSGSTSARTPPASRYCTTSPSPSVQKIVRINFNQDLTDAPTNNAVESDSIEVNARSDRRVDPEIQALNLQCQSVLFIPTAQSVSDPQERSMFAGTCETVQDTRDRYRELGEDTESDIIRISTFSKAESARDQVVSEDMPASSTPTTEDMSDAAECSISGGSHDTMQDTRDSPLNTGEETENDVDCASALSASESAGDLEPCEARPDSISSKESRTHISSAPHQEFSTSGNVSRKRRMQVNETHKSRGRRTKSRRTKSSVEQMRAIPAGMLQPQDVEIAICRTTNVGHDRIPILLKLLFGIGHPRWFVQLRLICSTLRTEQKRPFPTSNGTITQSFDLFEHLQDTKAVSSVRRRHCLVDLVRHRNVQRQSRQRASNHKLPDMIREACSELCEVAESSPTFQSRLDA